MTLGKLALHFDTTKAITATIAGDGDNKKPSWKMKVSNKTGTTVTIGDPTTILWATDGSGHVAVSQQHVAPDSEQVVVVSFELPKVLTPLSITFTVGSAKAEVKVKGG
jgi:hypothetical protein